MRKIKTKLLVLKTLAYRPVVIIIQSIVTFLYYKLRKPASLAQGAIELSIVWNVINAVMYYIYDYFFMVHWKIGENNDKN